VLLPACCLHLHPVPSPRFLIVIGTSAGGIPALTQLVAQLPASLPAALLVVQHLSPDSQGEIIVERLAYHTRLRCLLATDQAPLEAGTLYLAPPDRHLLAKEDRVLVTKGPRENHYRPAVDALFRSAAVAFGPNVVGVVLTGMLHDGTAGLEFVKRCGGVAVVQDPTDAEFPSMPQNALNVVEIDYVVPLAHMGELLAALVTPPTSALPATVPVPQDLKVEAAIAERVMGTTEQVSQLGHQIPLTCPDCGGALWEMEHGHVQRFRCHTGHAFTAEALNESSRHALEETLWVALRMMEERKILLTSMATREGAPSHGRQTTERLDDIKNHINRLREFMLNGGDHGPQPYAGEPTVD
jgi:two-component system chemotaxis response regulator CheB